MRNFMKDYRRDRSYRSYRNYRNYSNYRSYSIYAISLFLSLFSLAGCSRYELEKYYDGRADVHLTYDWESEFGEKPDGMTLILAHDGDAFTYYDATNNVDEVRMRLESGEYKATVLNRTFAEFGTMQFYQRNSHEGLYAQSNTWTQTTEQAWDEGRVYMEEPERIGVAVDTFMVPHTIDDLVFYNWEEDASADTIHLERKLVVMPMTTTLHIRCKIFNAQYMKSVEGFIAGMADGFLLNQGWRRTQTGTLKLDKWQVGDREWLPSDSLDTRVTTRAPEGVPTDSVCTAWISTDVETFGLPHGRELLEWRTPESLIIVLHFTLIDGTGVDFSYPVGKVIRYVGDDGSTQLMAKANVMLELDLQIEAPFISTPPVLPYAQPEGTGQFGADVQPWDDEEQIDVEI